MKEVTINKNDADQRLDKFLTKYLINLPQSMLYKSLRKNCVRVNGRHVRDGGYMLRENDVLTLYFRDEFFSAPSVFTPSDETIDVVYEDENIILINKPHGVVVHSDDNGTSDTLLLRMQSYLYKKSEYKPDHEQSFAPAFCNRLDRNTTGLIIGAKNAAALRIINEKIRTREIKKLYMCIAEGEMSGSGTLSAHLTRGEKKVTVTNSATDTSKAVNLHYTVLKTENNLSFLEIELGTGRTHQIRAQLGAIGHPLAGDKKYGSKHGGKMFLTSYKLNFAFTSDAGILNYLKDKEFQIKTSFFHNSTAEKL